MIAFQCLYENIKNANRWLVCFVFTTVLLGVAQKFTFAQTSKHKHNLLRVYEDNDFINVRGKGTDRWYSHGFRLDLFSERKNKIPAFPFPNAGKQSINTYGWGIMQIFITPSDLSKKIPDTWDYPYASSLILTRSVHSSEPVSKITIQSELSVGVLGPASMANETQIFVHKRIGDEIPMGWDTQWKNDLLINYSASVERQVFCIDTWFEVMLGGRVTLGSSLTGAAVFTVVRIGKMNNYFDGLISQFTSLNKLDKKWQAYITVIPSVEYSARNALLVGGLFRHNESNAFIESSEQKRSPEKFLLNVSYGIVIASEDVSISITQKSFSSLIEGLPRHEVGNISFYLKI